MCLYVGLECCVYLITNDIPGPKGCDGAKGGMGIPGLKGMKGDSGGEKGAKGDIGMQGMGFGKGRGMGWEREVGFKE